jgi:hypothetical protein
LTTSLKNRRVNTMGTEKNERLEAIAIAVNEEVGSALMDLTNDVVEDAERAVESAVDDAMRSIVSEVTDAVREALERAFDERRSFNVVDTVYDELSKREDAEREPSTAKLDELVEAIIFATDPSIGFFETATRLASLRQSALAHKNEKVQS